LQRGDQLGKISEFRALHCRCDFSVRCEVQRNFLAVLPVRRNLQDCRSAETAMSNQHFFAKRGTARAGNHFRGNAGQVAILFLRLPAKNEWNERGPCGLNFQCKLFCHIVSKRCGAHFWNGKPAGGNEQGWRAKFLVLRLHNKFSRLGNFANSLVQAYFDAAIAAFRFQ
jgi:hypothetical protein